MKVQLTVHHWLNKKIIKRLKIKITISTDKCHYIN